MTERERLTLLGLSRRSRALGLPTHPAVIAEGFLRRTPAEKQAAESVVKGSAGEFRAYIRGLAR